MNKRLSIWSNINQAVQPQKMAKGLDLFDLEKRGIVLSNVLYLISDTGFSGKILKLMVFYYNHLKSL